MYIKMQLHYLPGQLWGTFVLSVTVCTVGYICVFRGDQIFMDFVSFLSMTFFEVLHT